MGPKKLSKKTTKPSVDSDTEVAEEVEDTIEEDSVDEEDDIVANVDDVEELEDNDEEDDDEDNGEEDNGEDNGEEDNGEDNVSETEMKEEDVAEELENCYFQYDTMIDEYETLGKPTRVPDEDRITLNRLTKYEMVRVLGIRTKQISVGAKTLVKNINAKSPIEISIYELMNKMLPFKIKRPLPNNTYEIWKIRELEVILSDSEIKGIISSFN